MKKNVIISNICGLCYGSQRAIDKTLNSLNEEKNIVLYKDVLHNKNVIKKLETKGANTVYSLNDIKENDFVIIRAHGEPYNTFKFLEDNNIKYLDCTCPNVKSINLLVKQKSNEGYKIIIIGKYGYHNQIMHPEVEGIAGWCNSDPIFIEDESEIDDIDLSFDKYFLVIQTTFQLLKAEKYIEKIKCIMKYNNKEFCYRNTLCNSQRNINKASEELAKEVDVMIVMGGKNSSNSNELYNNISKIKQTYFIENKEDVIKLINDNKILDNQIIGITAGASTLKEDILEIKNIIENM